jgi:drug/metabolite transporter (DMT)-like permease
LAIGFLGAGGQLILFHAVTIGPTYLIFPIVSLSPAVTIVLSFLLIGERTGKLGLAGMILALISLPLFDYSPDRGAHLGLWFFLSLGVMAAWGLQAYYIKVANATMDAESIFAYMTLAGLLVAPAAWWLTDFSHPVYLGLSGPYLAAVIQLLNAVGALLLVYAFRYGKAIVVSPLINAGAPLLTTAIALALAGTLPGPYKLAAAALALAGAVLLSLQPE